MKRNAASLIGLLGMALLLIGINLVAERVLAGRQFDLTSQHLYTLSEGTERVLASVREPITFRLYYSPALGVKIPQFAAHAEHVREMLRDYAQRTDGRIRLEFITPEPFSEAEDRATGYGLQAVPLEQGGEKVFFGLAGSNSLDDERIIAFFQPERERFLEYDLTKLVLDLSRAARPVLGVMTALKMDGDPQQMLRARSANGAGQPWTAMLNLRQAFTVRTVATDATAIDPDIQVLLVVHPQNLSDATLYAIDQFVMRGGRLMAMVSPTNETLAPDPQTGVPTAQTASDLPRLFRAWGIAYDPEQAVGDTAGAWKVREGQGQNAEPVDYVAYFSVRDGINHDDPATAELQEVTLANAGTIALTPASRLMMTPLLTASDQSALLPAVAIRTDPDPKRILASFRPDGKRHVIAARLRGPVHSAFDAAPAGASGYIAQTEAANIVVIADTDMLSDRFWTRTQDFFGAPTATPFADNGGFVANLAGSLAGGDALIGLRRTGSVDRPFTVVDRMQRDAETRYRQTEAALTAHLEDTTKKLDALRAGRDGSSNAALDDAQRSSVEDLRRDMLDTRAKLRGVQLELRRDIAALQRRLQLFDIGVVPVALVVLAILVAVVRRLRRTRLSP